MLLYSAPIRNNFEIFDYRNYRVKFVRFITIGVLCGMHKEVKKPKIMKAPTGLLQHIKESLNISWRITLFNVSLCKKITKWEGKVTLWQIYSHKHN